MICKIIARTQQGTRCWFYYLINWQYEIKIYYKIISDLYPCIATVILQCIQQNNKIHSGIFVGQLAIPPRTACLHLPVHIT